MTNPRTLKELIKKCNDELSFAGYTVDALQECAEQLIAAWEKELKVTFSNTEWAGKLKGKIEAFKEFFGVE